MSFALKLHVIASLPILLAATACKKTEEPAPLQDTSFEIKYSSDGMVDVDAQFGVSEKSQLDRTWSGDILTGKLDASVQPDGRLAGTGKYRTGDKVYVYVKLNDITNPSAMPPAGNGFLAASLYINNKPCNAVRLSYYDYHNSPQKRYVDSSGKTNLLIESTFTVQ